jgi:hypothetical protein
MKCQEELNKDKRAALQAAATYCGNRATTQEVMFNIANRMYAWLNPVTISKEQLGIQDTSKDGSRSYGSDFQ